MADKNSIHRFLSKLSSDIRQSTTKVKIVIQRRIEREFNWHARADKGKESDESGERFEVARANRVEKSGLGQTRAELVGFRRERRCDSLPYFEIIILMTRFQCESRINSACRSSGSEIHDYDFVIFSIRARLYKIYFIQSSPYVILFLSSVRAEKKSTLPHCPLVPVNKKKIRPSFQLKRIKAAPIQSPRACVVTSGGFSTVIYTLSRVCRDYFYLFCSPPLRYCN